MDLEMQAIYLGLAILLVLLVWFLSSSYRKGYKIEVWDVLGGILVVLLFILSFVALGMIADVLRPDLAQI